MSACKQLLKRLRKKSRKILFKIETKDICMIFNKLYSLKAGIIKASSSQLVIEMRNISKNRNYKDINCGRGGGKEEEEFLNSILTCVNK